MVPISVTTNASTNRNPRPCSANTIKTSKRSQEHPDEKWQPEKQFQSDGGAQNLRKIARGDGQFADDPEKNRDGARIVVPASLREVAARGNAQLGGEPLQKHRHQVADQYHAEQGIPKFRSSANVRGPVARVHITHGNQVARPGKGEYLAKPRGTRSDLDGAMGFGQRRQCQGVAPAGSAL